MHDEETDQVLQVNQYHIGKLLGRGVSHKYLGSNGLLGKKQTFAIKVMDKKTVEKKTCFQCIAIRKRNCSMEK